uniref:Uncharacterized protein n=1 Tax=Anguilla anguilla TaxID=7936 RepID=A0A0E9R279_ANGAN
MCKFMLNESVLVSRSKYVLS